MPAIASAPPRFQMPQETPLCVTATVALHNPLGLHARPATLLVRTLNKFDCTVTAECGGHSTNSKSLRGLLCLAAGYKSKLTFTATGHDARQALAAVQQLFDTQFETAYTSP